MSAEQSPEYFDRSFISDEVRRQRMFDNMSELVLKDDPAMAIERALYTSVLDAYACQPLFKSAVDEFVSVRTDMTETHLRYMIRSVVQKQAMRLAGVSYPAGFEERSKWDEVIAHTMSSDEAVAEMRHDFTQRHLQTNIPDRYKSVVLAANWARANGRMGEAVTVFDFGCSRNLGLKTIAAIEMNRDMDGRIFHNFGPTEVVDPVDVDDITRAKEIQVDRKLSGAVTKVQAIPMGLRIGLGYDIEDMYEPGNKEWSLANLTPHEHANGTAAFLDLFEESFNKGSANFKATIRFRQDDILLGSRLDAIDKEQEAEPSDENGFSDITLLFTVLNQMSERQRSKAIMRAIRYTKPTGIVLIQDFARVMVDVPVEIEFMDRNWNSNYSYRTIMLDMMNRRRFQEIMRWDGGRAHRLNIPVEGQSSPKILAAEGYEPIDLRTYLGKFAIQASVEDA